MHDSFFSLGEFQKLLKTAPNADSMIRNAAIAHNSQLTKPLGSLGRLEELAVWYASWRRKITPQIIAPQVLVFAGNHGIAAQSVSAFPAEVTQQMVINFRHGGAAINQLSKAFGASLDICALDLDRPTNDFTKGPAMSEDDVISALKTGWKSVDIKTDLLVVGEMGIGNSTSAAAIATALFGGEAEEWVGRGTGVDQAGLKLKSIIVTKGLEANPSRDPLQILANLGGRELAAMAGAIVRARHLSIPVILDGFICTAAAACLEVACKGALDHCVSGHQSEEQAHGKMLEHLNKRPILSLGMRLGEGSGAALAIGILKGAIACHSGMASFDQAGVSAG